MKKKKMISQAVIITILSVLCILFLIPIILLISASLTDVDVLYTAGYSIIPNSFSLDAYRQIMDMGDSLVHAYGVSIFVTVVGTALGLVLTATMAYPIANRNFAHRNLFTFLIFFTMLFNGGIVSSYLVWTRLFHINNTIWAQIFPNMLVMAMNVILVKNYFASTVPFELNESAKIDGAGELQIFVKIYVPLSKPIFAAVGLLTGLGYWNSWVNGYYYISDNKYLSFQNVLDNILKQIQYLSTMDPSMSSGIINNLPAITIRMTLAVIGVLPILIIYPFFEKYFEKGLTVGAVKG